MAGTFVIAFCSPVIHFVFTFSGKLLVDVSQAVTTEAGDPNAVSANEIHVMGEAIRYINVTLNCTPKKSKNKFGKGEIKINCCELDYCYFLVFTYIFYISNISTPIPHHNTRTPLSYLYFYKSGEKCAS